MQRNITIGTRESPLAMIQARHVQDLLQAAHPGLRVSLLGMTTTGDQIQNVALNKIGSKSLFTKELEVALLAERVDLIVHSLKDMPTVLPPGLCLAGVTARENPADAVLVAQRHQGTYTTLADLPAGAVVGTSSVRRMAQLRYAYPHLTFKDARGNLNTRLAKLDDPAFGYDCLILAYAGAHRLGWDDRITSVIPSETMLHAVGQGALGLECRSDDRGVRRLIRAIAHRPSEARTLTERAYMRFLEGGCSVPLGVQTTLAATANGYTLTLDACVASVRGDTVLRSQSSSDNNDDDAAMLGGSDPEASVAGQTWRALGEAVGKQLLEMGARPLLDEAKQTAVVVRTTATITTSLPT
ncbi:hypothetical protein CXG81DRAFT_29140 [Caulochytrium protostelioides]|uniref:hydroxymethylbilane synthase n=1 Tax=Caulochytrium protostelioides TaxID=1555241 RepID=A0A4P9XFH4_9FUNG|nr:hypothetical protein CXG81DRAFT_29140 [Caulochytrium protostelioides]|eukprot:RKP03900.1 hypothetical protein CXG81DRAFT_29140 [Caulochytrium protostelioides]